MTPAVYPVIAFVPQAEKGLPGVGQPGLHAEAVGAPRAAALRWLWTRPPHCTGHREGTRQGMGSINVRWGVAMGTCPCITLAGMAGVMRFWLPHQEGTKTNNACIGLRQYSSLAWLSICLIYSLYLWSKFGLSREICSIGIFAMPHFLGMCLPCIVRDLFLSSSSNLSGKFEH